MVGGQRYDTLHDTLYAEIKRMATDWGIYSFIEWREAPMQMRYNGHFVYFGTYESVDASRGYTNISLLLLDEMFLAPLPILSVWGPCMRGPEVDKPRIIGATTPRVPPALGGGRAWYRACEGQEWTYDCRLCGR